MRSIHGFPCNDRWRAEVDGRLLSAIERGATEAVREVAEDTEQLTICRHVLLGVNIDVLVDEETCLPFLKLTSSSPVLQLTSGSGLGGDAQDP